MTNKPYLLVVLLAALFTTTIHAQEVDSVTLNGEKVYVYPFEMDVDQSYFYSNGFDNDGFLDFDFTYEQYLEEQRMISSDESEIFTEEEFASLLNAMRAKTYREFSKYWLPKMGPKPSKKEFKFYAKMRKRGNYYETESSYMDKRKFKKALRANPYPFLLQEISLDQDITPMLDPIPDGNYIQYYQSYCMIQEDGGCDQITDQIAGYFTIKDNLLHGEATWIDLEGDTIKHGFFDNGSKVGTWEHLDKSLSYFDDYQARLFVKEGFIYIDTVLTVLNFEGSVKNGEYRYYSGNRLLENGWFTDGEPTGEWTERYGYSPNGYNSEMPVRSRYTLNSDENLVVHPVVVRTNLADIYEYNFPSYDFSSQYGIPELPLLYEVAFPKEENFDLKEESEATYYDDIYMEDYYEGNWDLGYYPYSSNRSIIYDPTDDKFKKRTLLYDSLGAYPMFVDSYEAFYPNGQLAYRYEFENGLMQSEPVIYWDNGTVHDEVNYNADSNWYVRKVYDYSGSLMETFTYDSIGNFLFSDSTMNNDYGYYDMVEIEGFKFYNYGYGTMEYIIPDSVLEQGLTERTVMTKRWLSEDTTVISAQYFDPNTMIGNTEVYNLKGEVVERSESTIADNYESWTGTNTKKFGPMELQILRSASIKDWEEVDSIPILMLTRPYAYNVDSDYSLYYEGNPVTGPMRIELNSRKFKIGKKTISFPLNDNGRELYQTVFNEYKYNGKIKNDLLVECARNGAYGSGGFGNMFFNFIDPLTSYIFPTDISGNNYSWGYLEETAKDEPRTDYIEGNFLDGKAQGTWRMYDQYGKVLTEATFDKGVVEGKVYNYRYQEPADQSFFGYNRFELDSFPEKRTYYLESVNELKHGDLDGTSTTYDWLGRVVMEQQYKDGYADGLSIERNHLAVNYAEYKDGVLDGYLRTYLTLPGKDSILLYDLNFQNGMLQGESVSYHTNGKISKRGFFLEGQPIEDYQGFDSLGTLYHYVKFEYSFPVEEKLWEENELSVRYLFNWEDSIYFVPMDITNSESLEALLVDAGLSNGWEREPYYGRQTIVEKSGVDYHLTKYYPNDTIARDGEVVEGKKSGHWEFFDYYGKKLYEVNYFDSLLVINDSVKFNSKGIYTGFDANEQEQFRAYIIEKSERFDCSHKDHYEVRQFYTIWEASDTVGRMNGIVYNYYDNGTIQSYGSMKDGLPDGEWRYYDPAGKLNKYGNYILGKRNGRWLSGDLSKTKYLGDICLNPNMPDIEEEIRFRENFLDIKVINYKMGRELNAEYYDINMNKFVKYEEEDEDEIDIEIKEDE